MEKPLTDKQEAFVQAILAGKTHYEAFMIAYPSSKTWKKGNIASQARKTLKNEKVAARYNELKAEYIQEKTAQSFYDRDSLLDDFIYLKEKAQESIEDEGLRQANSNAYINSLKNIGDILGLYPDKKQNIKLDGDIKTSINNPFAELTEQELRKLIDDDK